MANRLLLDLEDYVRIVNVTGETIEGRYDGVNYEFPDAQAAQAAGEQEYTDVHKSVATHIFGFGLADAAEPPYSDRTQCLFRLGWLTQSSDSYAKALKRLKEGVQFHPVPQFPSQVLEFRKAPASVPTPIESAARVPSTPMGQGEEGTVPATAPSSPMDPFPQPKGARAAK